LICLSFTIFPFITFISITIYYPPDDVSDKYEGSDSMYKLSTISFTSFMYCYHFKQLALIITIPPFHPLTTRHRFSHFITPLITCHPPLISTPLIHSLTLISPRRLTRITPLTSIAKPSLLLKRINLNEYFHCCSFLWICRISILMGCQGLLIRLFGDKLNKLLFLPNASAYAYFLSLTKSKKS